MTGRVLVVILGVALAGAARADTFAQDLTGGVLLPAPALAGDQDASAVTLNPAGLVHLGGFHLLGVGAVLASDDVTSHGAGGGLWVATPLSIPLLPRMGVGAAVEKLFPPRDALVPDAGKPLRLSLAWGVQTSKAFAFGAAWHHFFDEAGGAVAGLSTFDLGLSARAGANIAAGLVVRNVFAPIRDSVVTERRWDGEVVLRPAGDDSVELAVGAAIGDRRGGFDPRLRVGARLAHGLYLRAFVEARTLWQLDTPASTDSRRTYDARAALGLEVSFGGVGAAAYVAGSVGDGGATVPGAIVAVRVSEEDLPSVVPPAGRIVRAKLSGDLDDRRLVRVLGGLARVERDPSAVALLLQIDGLDNGWGTLQELRDAIARVRARGKKVFAYLTAGTTRDYYVAVAADRLYLDAAGGVRLIGLSSQLLFFKELFEKIGVVAQFEKIAEYKSAPEQWTLSGSSPAAREMRAALLDDIFGRIVADIARDRRMTQDEVRHAIDNGPYTAGEAGKAGIVDAVIEPSDLDALVVKELGRRYSVVDDLDRPRDEAWERPKIAVVSLEGDIVDGKSVSVPFLDQKLAGGETLAASIAWARDNPSIHAIVLRVSSPGGSALASDVIAREVAATRGKKPIIVSIGDVAASGGYFAAAPGDLIFAEPGSITGSIGIFTGKFDLSTLAQRIGVTWDTAKRGARADMESLLRPYTDEERRLLQQKLRYFYDRFVSTVARGRKMSEQEVDAVGRGRVWTGAQAMERRLIDRRGGLFDAIVEAKARAGIPEDELAELVVLPFEPDTLVSKLLKLAGTDAAPDAATVVRPLLRALPGSVLFSPRSPQARLPFMILDD